MKGRDSMKYLYKITVVIDDDKVLRFQQHDLNAIYQTVRDAFKDCNFKEVSDTDKELVFVIKEGKDSFSEVGMWMERKNASSFSMPVRMTVSMSSDGVTSMTLTANR